MRAPSRAGIVLGLRVGAVAVSAVLFGSACNTYGAPPAPPNDAGQDAAPPDAAQTP